MNNLTSELSVKDTNRIKGIALICLLIHHLFSHNNGLFNDLYINGYGIFNELSKVCKVCVPLFVFLSGYGLIKSTKGNVRWSEFIRCRLSKLMPNYWIIWLLFVPIGVFVFHRTFEYVYVDCIFLKFLLDVCGLINVFGFFGYNSTWWFMSCIIMLYAIYPFLIKLMSNKTHYLILLITSLLVAAFQIPLLVPIKYYLFTFVIGIIFAKENLLTLFSDKIKYSKSFWFIILIVSISVRILFPYKLLTDTFVSVAIVLLFNSFNNRDNLLCTCLHFIGKHSMNIFLLHTFIYSYYFKNFIYSPRNPILIFSLLLGICLVISVGIERLKGVIKFSRIQHKLNGK